MDNAVSSSGGSFDELFTFLEVAFIYHLDTSTLRKRISRGELKPNVDVKKFGGTWLITKKAMTRAFGKYQYEKYIEEHRNLDFMYKMGLISLNEKLMIELGMDGGEIT